MGRSKKPDNIYSQDANIQTVALSAGLFFGGLVMIPANGLMLIALGIAVVSSGSLAVSARLNRVRGYEEHLRQEAKTLL